MRDRLTREVCGNSATRRSPRRPA